MRATSILNQFCLKLVIGLQSFLRDQDHGPGLVQFISPKWSLVLVFQGPVQSGFLAFFGQDRDRTGLQKFPFWEKTEIGRAHV